MSPLRPVTPASSYDALVIGAGLAGSGTAAALARRGWRVLLVEKDRFPRRKVCGEFLSPESQQALEKLGLLPVVSRLGPHPLHRAEIVTRRGQRLGVSLPGTAWGVSRYALDAALAHGAEAAGAELREATAVSGYARHSDGYRIHLRRGETVRARAVIAACGRHSSVGLPPQSVPASQKPRTRLGVGVQQHYTGIDSGDTCELYFFPGGYCGINRVEDGSANVCLLADYDACAGRSVGGMLAAAAAANPALGARLASGRPIPGRGCAVAPVDVFRANRPWDGIACVGDSASMIPPLCGDGMAMALQAAALCAPLAHAHLSGALSLAEWQAAYSRQWQTAFAPRLRAGRFLQRLLAIPLLSDGAIAAGGLFPPLAQFFVRATRG